MLLLLRLLLHSVSKIVILSTHMHGCSRYMADKKNSNLKFVASCLLNLKLFHILKKNFQEFEKKKEKKLRREKVFQFRLCVYNVPLNPFFLFFTRLPIRSSVANIDFEAWGLLTNFFFCVCVSVCLKKKYKIAFFFQTKSFAPPPKRKIINLFLRCIVYKHILLAFKSSWPTFFFIIAWLVLLFFCASSSYFAVRWNFIMSRWNDFFFFSPVREKKKVYECMCAHSLLFFFSSPSSLFPLIM